VRTRLIFSVNILTCNNPVWNQHQ